MQTLTVDPTTSRFAVRTRAAGLLARLAHDLELVTRDFRLAATLDGHAWTATITVPVATLRVAGTLDGERLDPTGLAPKDRVDVERKVRSEVLPVREVAAHGRGTLAEVGAAGSGELQLTLGRTTARTRVSFELTPLEGGAYAVTGRCVLSLEELGIRPVKGPLGAFRLKDDVEVRFELTVRPGG
jgi:hypothetical protein